MSEFVSGRGSLGSSPEPLQTRATAHLDLPVEDHGGWALLRPGLGTAESWQRAGVGATSHRLCPGVCRAREATWIALPQLQLDFVPFLGQLRWAGSDKPSFLSAQVASGIAVWGAEQLCGSPGSHPHRSGFISGLQFLPWPRQCGCVTQHTPRVPKTFACAQPRMPKDLCVALSLMPSEGHRLPRASLRKRLDSGLEET